MLLYEDGVFFHKFISLMPDDRLERTRKGSSKNRNAIWKIYYLLLTQDCTNIQNENEKPVSGLLSVRFVSPQFVCIVVLQHKGEGMSFLTELISRLTGA